MTVRLSDYAPIIGPQPIEVMQRLGERLRKKRVKMVNSTAVGGGVAEILQRLVPLFNELGVQTSWEVLKGGAEFFGITKAIHNALHGTPVELSPEVREHFLSHTRAQAETFRFDEEFVFIHDPQPVSFVEKKGKSSGWVWRCHIDISSPHPPVWDFLRPFVEQYDASIFSAPSFAQELPIPQYQIPPSIDPLALKNRELPEEEVRAYLEEIGLNPERPIVTQISRFDRLKDPLGVMAAHQLVKRQTDCQLVLAGGSAADDPEGAAVLAEIKEKAAGDSDIHILELPPFSDLEINKLQRGSTVVLQKSLKEGFALTVAEALWKKKPVVASAVGGIPLQVIHNQTGLLVHSVEGAALKIKYLLTHPEAAQKLGENGYQHVKQHFLITRHLRDYLAVIFSLSHPGKDVIRL
ncbi:MAG: glycosyltransferase [candidate division Zixibacteria bacterium]|nr:glycosyltransferase [candidate division Zixibacteria bacterium]MCI0595326.1 glycosyltransferase [candidate division Zixibacteria bacterium]